MGRDWWGSWRFYYFRGLPRTTTGRNGHWNSRPHYITVDNRNSRLKLTHTEACWWRLPKFIILELSKFLQFDLLVNVSNQRTLAMSVLGSSSPQQFSNYMQYKQNILQTLLQNVSRLKRSLCFLHLNTIWGKRHIISMRTNYFVFPA